MSKAGANKTGGATPAASQAAPGRAEAGSLWARRGDDIVLALLIVYVILLGIGTVAELFDIRSVLSWPIYR